MADEEKQHLNRGGGNNNNNNNADDEEVEGYSSNKCWNGYCGCIVWCCKGI
jgi:hypothetical protein